jgi:hypothetical protein
MLDSVLAESVGAWQKEVAERQPFLASPAAEKGSEIANRNSLREKLFIDSIFIVYTITYKI